MANPYRITRAVPRDPAAEYVHDPEFDHAVKFATIKRDAALMPVLRSRTPGVVTVTDDPADNLEEIQRRMDEGLFSSDASRALRPASRGIGRGRDR